MRIVDVLQKTICLFVNYYTFFTFWIKGKNKINNHYSKTLLVIRIDAIGDCIIWLDQAKEYRKAFPEHKIVLLHNKVWTEIAERLPWFDECFSFDRGKIGVIDYYKHIITQLDKYSYEKVFSPVFSRDFFTVDWIVHNVNAKEKIGYDGDYQNNRGLAHLNLYIQKKYDKLNLKGIADNWYTQLVPNDNNCVMELQRNANFVRKAINPDFQSKLPVFPFKLPLSNQIPTEKYAILFLGASYIQKTWPLNNFIEIAQYIPYNTIVLCGDKTEQPIADEFLSLYKGDKTIFNLTGKTSLIELISIISTASFIITNDTSASHIAVATKTPSICILGGGHYGRFHPYQTDTLCEDEKRYLPKIAISRSKDCFNCNFICKHPLQNNRWKCIDEIEVEDVIAAINETLKQGK